MALLNSVSIVERMEVLVERTDNVPLDYGPTLDPLRLDYIRDPYPAQRYYRENNPVHVVPTFGGYCFFRYDDCLSILRDHKFSHNPLLSTEFQEYFRLNPDYRERTENLVARRFFEEMDPPDHTRLRRMVSPALSKSSVARFVDLARQYFDAALDEIVNSGSSEFDLQHFSQAPPARLLAAWAGFPVEDDMRFVDWARAAVRDFDPTMPMSLYEAIAPMQSYMEELIADRRKSPGSDLLSDLIRAHDEGEMTLDELIGVLTVLVVGAGETASSAINNAVLALIQHPEQWDQLKADPSLAAAVPDATLRYDGIIQVQWRVAMEDREVAGVSIPAGEKVYAMLGSANRDPARFQNPDLFDLRLNNNKEHLGFADGIHKCVGLHLARMEMVVALEVLSKRLGRLELTSDPEYLQSPALHIIERLPVAVVE